MGIMDELLIVLLVLIWMSDNEENKVRKVPSVCSWTTSGSTDKEDENNIFAKISRVEINE